MCRLGGGDAAPIHIGPAAPPGRCAVIRNAPSPIRSRLWRTAMRPAVAASLLLHAAAMGGVLWLYTARPVAAPGPAMRTCLVERCQDVLDERAEVPMDLVFEEPLPDLVKPDPIEMPQRCDPELDLDAVFEEEPQPTDVPPPAFEEIPLRLGTRPRPPPLAPPPPPTLPRPAPRPVTVSLPPPPTPRREVPAVASRAPPRAAAAPLRIVFAPDPRGFYPAEAERRGLQGSATVVLLIDARGTVAQASLERTSGSALLDAAALELARAYRFTAGDGWRRTRLPVTFRILTGAGM